MMMRFNKSEMIFEAARLRTSKDAAERRASEMMADAAESIDALLDERDALQALLSTSIDQVYRLIEQISTTAFEEGWRAADGGGDDLVADWNRSETRRTLQTMPREAGR
jgi:hypothetical protein